MENSMEKSLTSSHNSINEKSTLVMSDNELTEDFEQTFDSEMSDYNMTNEEDEELTSEENAEESDTNLIVNYIPQNMTQDEVRSLFSPIGELVYCKVVKQKFTGQSLGYGFVEYKRAEDAAKAIRTLNRLRLQNKIIKVSYARPRSDSIKGANLHVSRLPRNMNDQELEIIFKPFGKVISIRILCDSVTVYRQISESGEPLPEQCYQLNRQPLVGMVGDIMILKIDDVIKSLFVLSQGVAFIRFDRRVEAERAIEELNDTIPEGATEPIRVKFAGNVNEPIADHSTPTPEDSRNLIVPKNPLRYSPSLPATVMTASGWSIYVFNLSTDIEDLTLWQLFGPFGAVQSVRIIRDVQTNHCRGYGFVKMTHYDEAADAIRYLNGYVLGQRVLQVSFAKTEKDLRMINDN